MKLTVGQYQALYQLDTTDEVESMVSAVSIVTGKTIAQVDDMPLQEVKSIYGSILAFMNTVSKTNNPASFLRANGRIYQLNYKIAKITPGQYTTVQFWLQDKDWIKNMDKILAAIAVPVARYGWVYLPKRKKPEYSVIAEDMQGVDFSQAYGSVVFFCKIFAASISSFLPSLEKDLLMKGKTMEEVQTFQTDLMKTLAGFTT